MAAARGKRPAARARRLAQNLERGRQPRSLRSPHARKSRSSVGATAHCSANLGPHVARRLGLPLEARAELLAERHAARGAAHAAARRAAAAPAARRPAPRRPRPSIPRTPRAPRQTRRRRRAGHVVVAGVAGNVGVRASPAHSTLAAFSCSDLEAELRAASARAEDAGPRRQTARERRPTEAVRRRRRAAAAAASRARLAAILNSHELSLGDHDEGPPPPGALVLRGFGRPRDWRAPGGEARCRACAGGPVAAAQGSARRHRRPGRQI